MRRIQPKHLATLLALGIISLAGAGVVSSAFAEGARFNPQVGLNSMALTTDPENANSSGRLGFHVGGNVRAPLGTSLYLAPGFYVERSGNEIETVDAGTLASVGDNVDQTNIRVPVLLGAHLSQSDKFGFRVFGGPSATFVTDVKENALGITKDDYQSTRAGLEFGAGADFGALSVDGSYELGLTEVYKSDTVSDAKGNAFRASVGLLFP